MLLGLDGGVLMDFSGCKDLVYGDIGGAMLFFPAKESRGVRSILQSP